MGMFDAAKDKATDYANENPEKVEQFSDQGIERAGDMADERTGGKFSEQIDGAQEQADGRIGE